MKGPRGEHQAKELNQEDLMTDAHAGQHTKATFSKLLSEVAKCLALFLEKELPALFDH